MKVLLATLHARYVHSSLALPCLASACAGIGGIETVIREFTVNEPHDETLRRIVLERADLAAFSCYIWNIEQTLRLVADLKQLLPPTYIVLGGPEASYGAFEIMTRHLGVDCIIRGEGEETFRELVAALQRHSVTQQFNNSTIQRFNDSTIQLLQEIDGLAFRAGDDIIATPERPPLADLDTIPSPFARGLVDLAKPLVYYETSRGCPFSCAFCMSSLERGVRSFSIERIRDDLRLLMEAKARTVKLVDRTFNYDAGRADDIWEFILRTNRESAFHFEIAADLLTEENLRLLEKVPAGMFRFEIGLQSGSEETLARVGRRSDLARLRANVRRLVETTGVTVHLDLVAGLPGEDFDGFLGSLQQVFDLLSINNPYFFACQGGKEEATEAYLSPLLSSPHKGGKQGMLSPFGREIERGSVRRGASDAANAGRRKKTDCFIQVEPLKVLKGTPMRTIAVEEGYRFSDTPPYKVLQTPWLSFADICRIEAIARLIDQLLNSGRFAATLAALARTAPLADVFASLAEHRERHEPDVGTALMDLFEEVWAFAGEFTAGEERERVREALCYDYCLAEYPVAGRLPSFFQESGSDVAPEDMEEKPSDLARRLGIGRECRVRTFWWRFARDPRFSAGEERSTVLRFVYISAPGRGLEVRVITNP